MRQATNNITLFKWVVATLAIFSGILLLWSFSEKGLIAKFSPIETDAYVIIDKEEFGKVKNINDLNDLASQSQSPDETFTRVSLKRDFVTDSSLYLWARKNFENRTGLKDIKLEMRSKDGTVISQYVLMRSKPLVWTVEAADPAVGGFHERIEFAVQEIAVY